MLVITSRHAASTRLCLHVLLQLIDVRSADATILHAALMGVDRLLEVLSEAEKTEALSWLIHMIVSHEGDDVCDGLLHILLHHGMGVIPRCEEVCRVMVKRYDQLAASTRMVLLQLLVKLAMSDKDNARVKLMLSYVMELNSKDLDVEVRVQARNIKAVGVRGGIEGSCTTRRTRR